jgi:hypothetical protein
MPTGARRQLQPSNMIFNSRMVRCRANRVSLLQPDPTKRRPYTPSPAPGTNGMSASIHSPLPSHRNRSARVLRQSNFRQPLAG